MNSGFDPPFFPMHLDICLRSFVFLKLDSEWHGKPVLLQKHPHYSQTQICIILGVQNEVTQGVFLSLARTSHSRKT